MTYFLKALSRAPRFVKASFLLLLIGFIVSFSVVLIIDFYTLLAIAAAFLFIAAAVIVICWLMMEL